MSPNSRTHFQPSNVDFLYYTFLMGCIFWIDMLRNCWLLHLYSQSGYIRSSGKSKLFAVYNTVKKNLFSYIDTYKYIPYIKDVSFLNLFSIFVKILQKCAKIDNNNKHLSFQQFHCYQILKCNLFLFFYLAVKWTISLDQRFKQIYIHPNRDYTIYMLTRPFLRWSKLWLNCKERYLMK